MKNASLGIIVVLVLSTICQTANAQDVSDFMNQTVYVDGHGITSSLKMWQSLLSIATPVILMSGAVIAGYVNFKIAETKKNLRTA